MADGAPATLATISAQLGINRSSTHRHLAALERAGRLQRRGRRLYAVPADGSAPATVTPISLPKDSAMDRTGDRPSAISLQERGLALLERITDLLAEVADMTRELIDSLPAEQGPRDNGAHKARIDGAPVAESDPLRRCAGRGPRSRVILKS